MENALQSLTNTLAAINTRQAAVRKRARKGGNSTPFTTAVLNRERLDIITYIRDADPHTEASLFWYPPVAQPSQQSVAGPSSGRSHQANRGHLGQLADDQTESELLIAPRLPEPRHIAPPTPLRKGFSSKAKEYASADDGPVDARVLLLAAQRLNDTYRRAPRARKHIKDLVKRHSSLTTTIKQYEVLIRENERTLRAASEGKDTAEIDQHESAQATQDDADSEKLRQDLANVQATIQNEELEILALEEMIAELEHARAEALNNRADESEQNLSTPVFDETLRRRPSSFGQPVVDDNDISKEIQPEPEDQSFGDVHPDVSLTEPSLIDEEPMVDQDFSRSESESFHQAARDESVADDTILADDDVTQTETLMDESLTELPTQTEREATPSATYPEEEQQEPQPIPESSDELERVTEKVWDVFGDALRHAAPEREIADFVETLEILQKLMSGGEKTFSIGDYSVGSTNTTSTTASEASSVAGPTQLTPEVLMTAFVIRQMLLSPEPHQMNIDDLKIRGHEWWASEGMQTWRRSRSSEESEGTSHVEAFEDGQNLARKATYGMISKQLFAIKRQKGVGLVGFA